MATYEGVVHHCRILNKKKKTSFSGLRRYTIVDYEQTKLNVSSSQCIKTPTSLSNLDLFSCSSGEPLPPKKVSQCHQGHVGEHRWARGRTDERDRGIAAMQFRTGLSTQAEMCHSLLSLHASHCHQPLIVQLNKNPHGGFLPLFLDQ